MSDSYFVLGIVLLLVGIITVCGICIAISVIIRDSHTQQCCTTPQSVVSEKLEANDNSTTHEPETDTAAENPRSPIEATPGANTSNPPLVSKTSFHQKKMNPPRKSHLPMSSGKHVEKFPCERKVFEDIEATSTTEQNSPVSDEEIGKSSTVRFLGPSELTEKLLLPSEPEEATVVESTS